MENLTLQEVENVISPLEKTQERMNNIRLYFFANEENVKDFRNAGMIVINKQTRDAHFRDYSSIYTSSGRPLEILDISTRMARIIRVLNLTIVR